MEFDPVPGPAYNAWHHSLPERICSALGHKKSQSEWISRHISYGNVLAATTAL
jgi:hypothetical protein